MLLTAAKLLGQRYDARAQHGIPQLGLCEEQGVLPGAVHGGRPELVRVREPGLCVGQAGVLVVGGAGPVLVQLDGLVDEVQVPQRL